MRTYQPYSPHSFPFTSPRVGQKPASPNTSASFLLNVQIQSYRSFWIRQRKILFFGSGTSETSEPVRSLVSLMTSLLTSLHNEREEELHQFRDFAGCGNM